VDYSDGLLFRPDQPLPVYASSGVAKIKAAEKAKQRAKDGHSDRDEQKKKPKKAEPKST